MADGNELDDDVEIDDVVYETEDEDGVISFVLPMAGFTTDIQKAWAEGVSKKIGTLDRELRLTRTQLSNAEVIANNAVAIASGVTEEDPVLEESEEDLDPPSQPSAPVVTSRLGNLEIFWDGNDFEGTPMQGDVEVVNVYAVKTSTVPTDPDWDLVLPYDDGGGIEPNPGVVIFSDTGDDLAPWTAGDGGVLSLSDNFHSAPASIRVDGQTGLIYMNRTIPSYTVPEGNKARVELWVYNDGPIVEQPVISLGLGSTILPPWPANQWTQVTVENIESGTQIIGVWLGDGTPGATERHPIMVDSVEVRQESVTSEPPEVPEDGETPPEMEPTVWPPTAIGHITSTVTGSNVIFSDLVYNEEYTIWFLAQNGRGLRSVASARTVSSVRPLVDTDVIGQIIAGANIVDGSIVASDKVIANTITGALIQALAIDTGHLKANAVTADKILAGTITAAKLNITEIWGSDAWLNTLRAGVIEVDMLMPNVGEKLNIFANEAVEIIVGRQDQQDTQISAANDAASEAQQSAEEASEQAGVAQGTAEEAAGAALVAQTLAEENGSRLDEHQAVFRVVSTGAVIASRDSEHELRLTPTRVEIAQGDDVVSYWEGARMVVNEAVLNRVRVGDHQIEKDTAVAGRTVFRPVT